MPLRNRAAKCYMGTARAQRPAGMAGCEGVSACMWAVSIDGSSQIASS